jgi:hypothetical protein
MKLLLDECTPKRLKRDFTGHQAFTVDEVACSSGGRCFTAVNISSIVDIFNSSEQQTLELRLFQLRARLPAKLHPGLEPRPDARRRLDPRQILFNVLANHMNWTKRNVPASYGFVDRFS